MGSGMPLQPKPFIQFCENFIKQKLLGTSVLWGRITFLSFSDKIYATKVVVHPPNSQLGNEV